MIVANRPPSAGYRAIFLLALLVAALPARAEMLTGRVVGVSDGDTITVLDAERVQHKIRLAGIDAPEKRQAFGTVARQALAERVFGQQVELNCLRKRDRYQRQVCVVLRDGKDVNLQLVQAGAAWWYRKYSREQTPRQRRDYEDAEAQARAAHRGLWRDTEPTPPWDWRHRRRSSE